MFTSIVTFLEFFASLRVKIANQSSTLVDHRLRLTETFVEK